LFNPSYEVILKGALDDLMKEVGRKELVDIGTREVTGKWLFVR